MKTRSRLDILNAHLNQWLEIPRENRLTLSAHIVETAERIGLVETLKEAGLTFNKTRNTHNDMRVNSQKIWRWLGGYDGVPSSPMRLFYAEQVMVAAMPIHLRLSYLNDIYSCADVLIGHKPSATGKLAVAEVAANVTKENSEAVVAMIHHNSCPTKKSKANTIKELKEAAGATMAAIDTLENDKDIS